MGLKSVFPDVQLLIDAIQMPSRGPSGSVEINDNDAGTAAISADADTAAGSTALQTISADQVADMFPQMDDGSLDEDVMSIASSVDDFFGETGFWCRCPACIKEAVPYETI